MFSSLFFLNESNLDFVSWICSECEIAEQIRVCVRECAREQVHGVMLTTNKQKISESKDTCIFSAWGWCYHTFSNKTKQKKCYFSFFCTNLCKYCSVPSRHLDGGVSAFRVIVYKGGNWWAEEEKRRKTTNMVSVDLCPRLLVSRHPSCEMCFHGHYNTETVWHAAGGKCGFEGGSASICQLEFLSNI